jgi:hypothetical protein
MPILSLVFIICLGLWVFSQFGRRLSARHAALWFSVVAFLLVAAAAPDSLQAIAHFFGFQLVSNFILSSLALLTFLELLVQGVNQTRLTRTMREAFCRESAADFLRRRSELAQVGRILVVSPCFNEELELPRTIERLKRVAAANPLIDFCIVNDGSKDNSEDVLRSLVPSHYARHLPNLGVSAVLMTGFLIARDLGAKWVVQCDADGQHPIELIPDLVAVAEREGVDLLIGSRFCSVAKPSDSLVSTTWQRWLGGRLISWTLRLFGRQTMAADPTSGFRVYSVRAARMLLGNMPDDYPEPESIAILGGAGMKIAEWPVEMQPRTQGVSSLSGGFKSAKFMFKIAAALLGLRLRLFFQNASF